MKKILNYFSVLFVCLMLVHCTSLSGDKYSIPGSPLPSECEQLVIGIADNWNTSHVNLVFLEKNKFGLWEKAGDPWPARLGSAGLVWGLGVNPVPAGGRIKTEGDKRTPAGIFEIDHQVFAYDEDATVGKGYTVRHITPYDLWVEDPKSPLYNHHLVLDHLPVSGWEKEQQMKQNDPSHKIKLFVQHNSPKDTGRPVPGAGSSIFFHIWRDNGRRATAGCTSMSEANMMKMLGMLDAAKNPMYIILPREEYRKYRKDWKLPTNFLQDS